MTRNRLDWLDDTLQVQPPRDLVERVAEYPTIDRAPNVESSIDILPVPRDVRGSTATLAGEGIAFAQATEKAYVSLLIMPPQHDREWTIEGRVWLRPSSRKRTTITWVHEDHVLQSQAIDDGEMFRLTETIAAGWTLEFHLPGGHCLTLEDPIS